jgi:hypothetical protein
MNIIKENFEKITKFLLFGEFILAIFFFLGRLISLIGGLTDGDFEWILISNILLWAILIFILLARLKVKGRSEWIWIYSIISMFVIPLLYYFNEIAALPIVLYLFELIIIVILVFQRKDLVK